MDFPDSGGVRRPRLCGARRTLVIACRMHHRTKNAVRARLAALATVVLVGGLAWAAMAADGEREAATRLLAQVEASPHKAAASELTARAKDATARAEKLRSAGDESHAKLADGLAKRWAEAALDVVKAVEAEERARTTRLAAADAGAAAERERALLEEGVAQKGRLRAQLDALEHGERAARTSAAAGDAGAAPVKGDPDGGAPPAKAPAKKKGAR